VGDASEDKPRDSRLSQKQQVEIQEEGATLLVLWCD